MKFRKLIPLLIFAALFAGYFTKPTKDDFMAYIKPIAETKGTTPVVSFEDKMIYTTATVFFVNVTGVAGENAASGAKEEYIGAFKKFWKQGGSN